MDFHDDAIVCSEIDMDLDAAFTELENSVVAIGPAYCYQFEALPVELYYAGIVDSNFTTGGWFQCFESQAVEPAS